VLYSMLSIAFGAVAILLVVVALLHCRGHRRRPTKGPGDGSRDALNATGSGNVYTPSPASSDDNRHVPSEGSPAWWSRDDEAKSQSGSLNHPSASATATIPRRYPVATTSGSGWMSEGDAASLATSGGTAMSPQGLPSTRRDRTTRNQVDDTDDQLQVGPSTERSVVTGYDVGQEEVDGSDSWFGNGGGLVAVDGTVGTLGRSFTNPYRHDSYRTDGMRSMHFK